MLGGGGFTSPGQNPAQYQFSALDLLKECANIRLIPLPPPFEGKVCVEAYASGSQGEIQFAGPGPEHHFEASHKLVWLEQESTLQVQEKINLVGQRPEITINGVPIELPKTIVGGPNIHILETPSVPPTLTISAVPSGDDGEIQFASGGHFPAPQNRFAGDNRLRWDDGRLEVTGEIVLNGEVLRKVEPAGSAGQIQFNAGGSPPEFGASQRLTWDGDYFRVSDSQLNNSAYIYADRFGALFGGWDAGADDNGPLTMTGSYIRFVTGPYERMRIDSQGNVGIAMIPQVSFSGNGTMVNIEVGNNYTPGGVAFFAAGTYRGQIGAYNDLAFPSISTRAAEGNTIDFYTGGTASEWGDLRMRIDNQGRVGINTQPETALDVAGVFRISDTPTYNIAQMTLRSDAATWYISNFGSTSTLAGCFSIQVAGLFAYPLVISPSGDIGINNGFPNAKLDVAGAFRITDPATGIPFVQVTDQGRILIDAPATYNQQPIFLESNGTEIGFLHENDSPFGIAGIACANDLRDNAFLYVAGSQIVADPPIAGNFNIVASKDIVFHTASTPPYSGERMRITSAGDVLVRDRLGIGTDSPYALLDIIGTVGVTALYVEGDGSIYGNLRAITMNPDFITVGNSMTVANSLGVGSIVINGPPPTGGASLFAVLNLPTADPGAGSKAFWADPSDGYRVKWAV